MIFRTSGGGSSVCGLLLFGRRLWVGHLRTQECSGFFVQWARKAWRVMPGYVVTP